MTKFYVYEIYNKITHKRYIGAKSTTDDPYQEIGKRYFSSSSDKDFKKDQRNNPENYTYVVLAVFDNAKDADAHEHYLQKSFNVSKNDMFYNKITSSATSGFTTYGKVTVRDKDGNTSCVSKDDPRYISGELVSMTLGEVVVRDKNGNKLRVSKDDPRYISGELISITLGKVAVRDKNGNCLLVDKNNPRYISGELVGIVAGKVVVRDKNGNFLLVDKNDPRYISGELVGVTKGRKYVYKDDKVLCVHNPEEYLKKGYTLGKPKNS